MGERIRCRKCGDILQSKHRHDFQMCKCGSCFIDGGDDYCRVGGKKEDIEWIDRKDKNEVYAKGLKRRGVTCSVILSPASASFDMFKNFMERGNKFKEIVHELIPHNERI